MTLPGIKRFLAAPKLADEEQNRQAQLLNAALLVLNGATVLITVIQIIVDPNNLDWVITGFGFAVLLFVKYILQRGRVLVAGWALCVLLLLLITQSAFTFSGIRDPTVTAYFLIIALGGLVLGERGAVILGILALLTVAGLYAAELGGVIKSSIPPTPVPFDLLLLIILFVVMTLVMRFAVKSIGEGFARVRQNEESLQERNLILQAEVSERKRIQQALVQTNAELEQLVYIISHDLKAPLRAIAHLSTWIEEDIESALTGEARQHMDLLQGRVQRMEALLNGILQYARVGRTTGHTETVAVPELLQEIVHSLEVPATFTIRIAPDMPTFSAERTKLASVFANLIENAVKYHHRQDGCIDISVQDTGDFYKFAVADDGPGIAPAYHGKIFEMFQTLQPRDKVESTGVGLAVARRIIEDEGGSLEIVSTEGQGATFYFTCPKSPAVG
jgi:signal transduction histidine kinase